MTISIKALLGVAGVHHKESVYAKLIGKRLEWLVLAALFAVFIQLLMFYSDHPIESIWYSAIIWGVFVLEFIVNLYNVEDRIRYIKGNWMNVLIIVIAFPWIDWGSDWSVIIRSLRLVLLLRYFSAFFQGLVTILNRNKFGQTVLAAAFMIIGSGAVFAYFEDSTLWDGVWYALATITTVGYGDIVPKTDGGRIFGSILIVFGVVFFSMVTANIAAFLIGSDKRAQDRDLMGYVRDIEKALMNQTVENEKRVEKLMAHFSTEIAELKAELKREKELEKSDK